jgi:hypothetical protein
MIDASNNEPPRIWIWNKPVAEEVACLKRLVPGQTHQKELLGIQCQLQ